MQDATHTPGKWYFEHAKGGMQLRGAGMTVFTIDAGALPIPADARLIETAPDLLEALREIVRSFDEPISASEVRAIDKRARAAIAKATTE